MYDCIFVVVDDDDDDEITLVAVILRIYICKTGCLLRIACRSSTQNSKLSSIFSTVFYNNTPCFDCNCEVTQAVVKLTVLTKYCQDIAYVSC